VVLVQVFADRTFHNRDIFANIFRLLNQTFLFDFPYAVVRRRRVNFGLWQDLKKVVLEIFFNLLISRFRETAKLGFRFRGMFEI